MKIYAIVILCVLPLSESVFAQLRQPGEPPCGIYPLACDILSMDAGRYKGYAPECNIIVGDGDSARIVTTYYMPKVSPEVLYSPAIAIIIDGETRSLEFPFAVNERLIIWRASLSGPDETKESLPDVRYICKSCNNDFIDSHRLELNTRELTELLPALRLVWQLLEGK